MKPILLTILALPIVAFIHHTPPKKTTVDITVTAQKQTSESQIKAPSAAVPPKEATVTAAPTTPAKPAPVASAPAVAQPVVYASGCSSYKPTFAQYGWNISVAMAICEAESSGNPNAVSTTDDYGLMQIHDGLALYGSKIFDPYFNISIAYIKYQTQGWEAWSTYNSGAYAEYL